MAALSTPLRQFRDYPDGTWDARNGALRGLAEYDAGLRLAVADPVRRARPGGSAP